MTYFLLNSKPRPTQTTDGMMRARRFTPWVDAAVNAIAKPGPGAPPRGERQRRAATEQGNHVRSLMQPT